MAILNYTTSVPAATTVAQIVGLLARKGAQSITQDFFEDGRVKAVSFVLRVGIMPVRFQLPANTHGVAGVLAKDKPYRPSHSRVTRDQYRMNQMAQAEMIAWRILKDWVEAQIALIESGQAEPAQVFMPYAHNGSGETMYDRWVESNQLQLPASTDEDTGGTRD